MRRCSGNAYPNTAAQFVAASSQSASIADNATLSMGAEIDFSIACWVRIDSAPASDFALVAKFAAAGTREYLVYRGNINAIGFIVSDNGTNQKSIFSTPTVSIGTWAFILAQHDATADLIRLYMDGVSAATAVAHTTGVVDGAQPFVLGRRSVASDFLDGRLDSVGLWRSAAGAGGSLSTAQITQLYKGGVGMAYKDLDADLKTALVSWYDLDGTLNDSHGTNHLVNNNGVSFAAGKR
jgi:hypothetical protein